jgi:hypothetical protein
VGVRVVLVLEISGFGTWFAPELFVGVLEDESESGRFRGSRSPRSDPYFGSRLVSANFSLVAQRQFRRRFRLLGIEASLRERPTIGFEA